MSIFDFILSFVPRSARVPALSAVADVEVYIAENNFGGWSIFAANDRARELLGGDEPTGNFGTHADAFRRAHDHNCWTVVDAPTLPGFPAARRRLVAA
jgi:hypothetical protein